MTADADRIEAARVCATQSCVSPAMTLFNVMAALGYDFGDPVEVEHQVMQYYASTEINPFVQAQLEAKIVIDAGELERLAQWTKHKTCTGKFLEDLATCASRLEHTAYCMADNLSEPDLDDVDCLAEALVEIIKVGLTKFGSNVFSSALGSAIDRLQQE